MFKYLSLILLLLPTISSSKVIHSERSLYRNIIVDENANQRCMKFDTKSSKTNQSCVYIDNSEKLVFNYTKLAFSSLLLIDEPKNVLIIGLGGGTLSNTIHKIYPNALIENVEIDPAVTRVARKYFNFIENEKIKSFTQDGRIFIKRAKLKNKKYDWIILDAFNGDYIPEHLLTQEFFQETKSVLSNNGVVSANTFSTSKLYHHESATYHAVFGDFINVSNKINSNRIILAGYKDQPNDDLIQERVNKLEPLLKPFGVDIKKLSQSMTFTKDKADWPKNTKILTDQYSPANLLNL